MRMEACLEEMHLANVHLENIMAEVQERLFEEQRANTREKAQERMRAKKRSVQHLGEAEDAERMIEEAERDAR